VIKKTSINRTVIFFLPSLGGGGAERVLLQIANGFSSLGYDVHLLTGDASGPYRSELSKEVYLVSFDNKKILFCFIPLLRYLRKVRPRAIVTTMMHANVMVTAACLVSRSNGKIIVRDSNIADVFNKKPLAQGKSLLLRLASFLYPKTSSVVAVSEGVKESITEALSLPSLCSPVVIGNPVISPDLFRLAKEPSDQDKLVNVDMPVIVAVGRLAKVKDFETLFHAFAGLTKEMECRLIVLGEGPERYTLEQLSKTLNIFDSVFMPGFVRNPFPVLAKASLYVSCSLAEGLPNSLIQALALKRKVVVTDCPHGPAEILEFGRWGRLVPCKSSRDFTEAMKCALMSGEHETPDENWFRKYSVQHVVNRYEKLITT